MRPLVLACLAAIIAVPGSASGQQLPAAVPTKWVTTWGASVQGPYPVGNPNAQPNQMFAFPDPLKGARDQTMRMIVRPTVWGRQARIRLSNVFGARPVAIGGIFVGIQHGGATVLKGTSRAVTFGGRPSVVIEPGKSVWSDPVTLAVRDPNAGELAGRKLAVSFHVAGESGPMTWHAKALQTSYVSPPGSGAKGNDESETHFPFSTASWFFLDAVDMRMPQESFAVVALGDSITDGTSSTMNGDDRWPDVLARRLHALQPNRVAVVNAGIGGNQVAGPAEYAPAKPFPGGPSARSRIDRDVLELSGVTTLIWLEGINDFSKNGNATADTVMRVMKETIDHVREKRPDMRVLGATLVSALGATNPNHGFIEQDEKRKTLNTFIRTSLNFDGVIDFDKVTFDPATGGLKPEFVPDSTVGAPGDRLHPNRAGYLAMGQSIDLELIMRRRTTPPPPVAAAGAGGARRR